MRSLVVMLFAFGVLSACGADGEPTAPVVSGKQTIGVSTNSGVFTKTEIGITFPAN